MKQVYVGQTLDFRTTLQNTGPLTVRNITVKDVHPDNAEFLGIRYNWLEYLLPIFRKVTLDADLNYVVHRRLRSGESLDFTTRYRALDGNTLGSDVSPSN